MSSRTAAARGLTAAAILSCALLAGCSSDTGGTAVGPTEATAFVTVTPSTSSTSSPAEATTPSAEEPTESASTDEPTESTTGSTESEPSTTARTTSPRSTTPKATATLGPSTDAEGKPVVAYWLGDPPADPDTPGPEGGPTCKADSQYVNEPTTGLQPDVVKAWGVAVAAAKKAGITLCLNDGKRSKAQQQAQYDQYVKDYGEEVAKQLALPPDRSAHVLGVAVDAQPAAGWQWLQQTKGSLGFCRRYDNEGWHFEYAPQFKTAGCPDRLPKPVG